MESSIPALHVRRLDRTIRIDADTSVPGPLDGIVTVTGPAGNAEIHVVGEVADPSVRRRRTERVAQTARPVDAPAQAPVEPVAEPVPAAASATPPEPAIAGTAPPASSANPIRRLIDRGWQTGHIQTLIGAEIGALAIVALDLTDTLQKAVPGLEWEQAKYVEFAVTYAAAVVGAALFLRLAGPPGYRRTVIALALLFPVYLLLGFVSPDANVQYFAITAIVAAVFALTASSLALLKRTQPA